MAWGIVNGTVLHGTIGLPHPDRTPGWSVHIVSIDFATGRNVILGALIVLSADVHSSVTWLLMAFGGGVYLQIVLFEDWLR